MKKDLKTLAVSLAFIAILFVVGTIATKPNLNAFKVTFINPK